jgi:hypothetical protein
VSDTASVRESPKANGAGEASNPARGPSPQHSGGGVTGERMGAMPTMTPEEIIFMRSLGWEDGEDDAEGTPPPLLPPCPLPFLQECYGAKETGLTALVPFLVFSPFEFFVTSHAGNLYHRLVPGEFLLGSTYTNVVEVRRP